MEKMNKKSTTPGAAALRPLLSLALLLTLLIATLTLTACAGHALRSQDQAAPASSQSQSLPASTSNQGSTTPSTSTGSGDPAQQVQSIDQQVQGTLPSLNQAQNDANSSDQGQDNAPLP